MSKQFSLTDFNMKEKVNREVKSSVNSKDNKFTFIEMFSGIGGFRLGLERSGWKCVWANEIDKYANKIYHIQFGYGELDEGDIRKKKVERIPNHTLLTAGFPCQSFSVAGKGKGFEDTRGTLFYEICRIVKVKTPKLLLLENVRGLLSNKGGETFTKILQTLDELGYDAEWQVLNSKYFGVPQSRQRVFIVGHFRKTSTRTVFPIGKTDKLSKENDKGKERVTSCLDANYFKGARRQRTYVKGVTLANKSRYKQGVKRTPIKEDDKSFALGASGDQGVAVKIIADRTRTKAGKGKNLESPKNIVNSLTSATKDNLVVHNLHKIDVSMKSQKSVQRFDDVAHTVRQDLSRNVEKPHNPVLLSNMRIRRLTPVECERLQGFPDNWTKWLSDTQRYKALGNAVTVNVIEYLGKLLKECLE